MWQVVPVDGDETETFLGDELFDVVVADNTDQTGKRTLEKEVVEV